MPSSPSDEQDDSRVFPLFDTSRRTLTHPVPNSISVEQDDSRVSLLFDTSWRTLTYPVPSSLSAEQVDGRVSLVPLFDTRPVCPYYALVFALLGEPLRNQTQITSTATPATL